MGICTSDPLAHLIREYGADVCKYIVSIKAEQYVDQYVPKLTSQVQQQFKTTSRALDKQFEAREGAIKGNFDAVVNSVKQSDPFALENAKKIQEKNQEQLLGFDSIQSQFSNLKTAKDSKLKDQESNILKMIDKKKTQLKQSIVKDRPSLPLLDSMPMCLKLRAISEAEDKYAPEIKAKQTEVTGVFEKIANVGDLDKTIKKMVGVDEADKLVKTSVSTFEKGKKLVTMMNNPKAGMTACC